MYLASVRKSIPTLWIVGSCFAQKTFFLPSENMWTPARWTSHCKIRGINVVSHSPVVVFLYTVVTHTVHSLVLMLTRQGVHERSITEHNKLDNNSLWGGEKDNVPVLLDTLLYPPLLPSSALYYSSHKGEEEGMPLFYSNWNVFSEACREVLARQHILLILKSIRHEF